MAHGEEQASPAFIATAIRVIREQKVILDADLAALYGVPTKRFNEAVRRNLARFPVDFMFRLSNQEDTDLRSQIATSSAHGGRRYLPLAFTEHGALMAATILNSPRAIEVSNFVVRAFISLRQAASTHKELARRIDELEATINGRLATQDQKIADIFSALRHLTAPTPAARRPIGFTSSP